MDKNRRVIISGGGTGGHVFPAIAIADALREIDGEIDILFVGANHKIEMTKVPAAGYSILGLPVTGFQRRVTLKNVLFIKNLMVSMIRAIKIVRNFKPDLVVGVGGYASGPVMKAASLFKIPLIIQEQNSYAGVTNKLLASKAEKICVAYEGMEIYFPSEKLLLTGNPVRDELTKIDEKRDEAASYFGLSGKKRVIAVLGGSLGAGTINRSILSKIGEIKGSNCDLIWQTGRREYDKISRLVSEASSDNIFVHEFIERMDLLYSGADIVISRSGAGTISELSITGKPAILVPSPNVAEDHQTKNAMALVNRNAAILVSDNEAEEKLVNIALNLVGDIETCNHLSNNIRLMAIPGSANIIAEQIIKVIDNKQIRIKNRSELKTDQN